MRDLDRGDEDLEKNELAEFFQAMVQICGTPLDSLKSNRQKARRSQPGFELMGQKDDRQTARMISAIDSSKPSTNTEVADRSKSGRDGRMSPAGPQENV
jgi:hypothetical protein